MQTNPAVKRWDDNHNVKQHINVLFVEIDFVYKFYIEKSQM